MNATCDHYSGYAAIAYARAHKLLLSRYHDSTGPARKGLTVEQAEEIAQRDPGLIYLNVVSGTEYRPVTPRPAGSVAVTYTRTGAVLPRRLADEWEQ